MCQTKEKELINEVTLDIYFLRQIDTNVFFVELASTGAESFAKLNE